MHSSTGSPPPACSNDHRTSISTPPPDARNVGFSAFAPNTTAPNSPARRDSGSGRTAPPSGAKAGMDAADAVLVQVTGQLSGRGIHDRNETLIPGSSKGAANGSADRTPTALPASPNSSSPMYSSMSSVATATAQAHLPSPASPTASRTVSSSNTSSSFSPSTVHGVSPGRSSISASSPEASPTFAAAVSASASPATKFVIPSSSSPVTTFSPSLSPRSTASTSFSSPSVEFVLPSSASSISMASSHRSMDLPSSTSATLSPSITIVESASSSSKFSPQKLETASPTSTATAVASPVPINDTAGGFLARKPSQTPSHSVISSTSDTSMMSESSTVGDSNQTKTPNVYINGLPPNFPEEQLHNMTREFGAVLSVRTFTRHVSDRPTGYGFVLFERTEDAEKCIESLRKFRNLHPSFSKQIHKIPGTVYASVSPPSNRGASGIDDSNSFKAKMEKLKDESSTNLYMEGLPLSIDEPTLSALISPYAIKSSRFFQTKLSHPPRIIAFVRLESRAACEEVIERLHGRMVRGWNDPGCRISVRFADSNEQRELRKTERSVRDGENSPNRLTIAQAALLNLRGPEVHGRSTGNRSVSSPTSIGLSPRHLQPHFGDRSPLPSHPLTAQFQQVQAQQRDMQVLLDSLNATGMGVGDGLAGLGFTPNVPGNVDLNLLGLSPQDIALSGGWGGAVNAGTGGLTPAEQLLLQAHAQAQLQARARLGMHAVGRLSPGLGVGHGLAFPSPSISPVPASLSRGDNCGQYLAQSSDYLPHRQAPSRMPVSSPSVDPSYTSGRKPSLSALPSIDLLPPMSEDEFHRAHQQFNTQERAFNKGVEKEKSDANVANGDDRLSFDFEDLRHRRQGTASSSFASHQQNHTSGPTSSPLMEPRQIPSQQQPSSSHMRSTTLPASHFGAYNKLGKNGTMGYGASVMRNNTSNDLKIDSSVSTVRRNTLRDHTVEHSPIISPALTFASRTPSTSSTASLSPITPYLSNGGGFDGVAVAGAGAHGHAGLGLGVVGVTGKGKGRADSQN